MLHLTSARLDAAMGDGTAARLGSLFERSKVGAWISTQEEAHRFLVFEADPEPTPWTRSCVRQVPRSAGSLFHLSPCFTLLTQLALGLQADCVLLVGQGSSPPDLSHVERTVLFRHGAARRRPSTVVTPDTRTPRNSPGGFKSSRTRRSQHAKGPRRNSMLDVNSLTFSRKELVLLHDPAKPPRGTRKWLRARRVHCHHHIR